MGVFGWRWGTKEAPQAPWTLQQTDPPRAVPSHPASSTTLFEAAAPPWLPATWQGFCPLLITLPQELPKAVVSTPPSSQMHPPLLRPADNQPTHHHHHHQRCKDAGARVRQSLFQVFPSEFFLGQHPPFPPPSFLSLLGQKGPSSCPQRTLPCPSQASSGICVHHLVSPSYRQIPHLLLFFLFTTSDFSRLLHPPNPFPQNGPLPLTPTHSLNDRFTPCTSPTSENLESAAPIAMSVH